MNEAEKMKIYERIKWIDCAKTIAIIAVAIDHCNGILYTNPKIAVASYYSVSLFVILAGISANISAGQGKIPFGIAIFNKLKRLLVPYAVATFVLSCYYAHFFDFKTYLNHLVNFTAAGPYYYFVFFIQLIIISPYMIRWCKRCEKKKLKNVLHMGTLAVLGIIAAITINYTFILNVHGGGKYLGGGSYILLYYIGILLFEKKGFHWGRKCRIFIVAVAFLIWIFWWQMMCQGSLPFDRWMQPWWGDGFNPPSVNFMIFALITLFFCYALFSLLCDMDHYRCITWFMIGFSWLGRNTLYIFLYHSFVRDIILRVMAYMGIELTKVAAKAVVFVGMIVIPVAFKELIDRILKKAKYVEMEQAA